MDIVLGVSMAPTVVRTVLMEGENADGVTVEQKNFDVASDDDAATMSAADQVITTILGTREGATQAGNALTSTGVTWTDPVEAAALREALATRKIENVMLVSAFMAAAALAQMVGSATGNAHTALLFVEPDTATLAVVDSADGSITDVHKELISSVDTADRTGRDGRRLGRAGDPPGAPVHRRVRCGHRDAQAAVGSGDVASRERTGRTGDGVGVGRSVGVGQRAVVCVVDRCPGIRARSRHRRGRSLRGVAGIPCGA